MTTDEIFSELSAHQVKGLMIHDQMSDYYNFLSLKGYGSCHEYHYYKEMCDYRKLHDYFINRSGKLVEERKIENPEVIPSSWYRYTQKEVDANTKRTAVKNGMDRWVIWEKETKALYQKAYRELVELKEEAMAIFLQEFIEDVSCELSWAEHKAIELETLDYDLSYIIGEQTRLYDKYKEKIKW